MGTENLMYEGENSTQISKNLANSARKPKNS